jgi:ribosomal protein L20A (L18A)
MNRWYWLALIFVAGCSRQEQPPLGEDKLIQALTDAHVMESALQQLSGTYKDSMRQVYFEQLLEVHEIREEDFRRSVDALARNPVKMERIYRKVGEEINQKEANLSQ